MRIRAHIYMYALTAHCFSMSVSVSDYMFHSVSEISLSFFMIIN